MYKVEVIADSSNKWTGNGKRFDTFAEAEDYAKDLFSRWTAVSKWRVVELKRMFYLIDKAVRVFVPISLDARGSPEKATTLRNLAPIVDKQTAKYAAYAAAAVDAAAYTAVDAAAYIYKLAAQYLSEARDIVN